MGMGALVPQKAQGGRFGVVTGKQTPKRPFWPVDRKKQRKLNPQPEGGTAHETRGLATSRSGRFCVLGLFEKTGQNGTNWGILPH